LPASGRSGAESTPGRPRSTRRFRVTNRNRFGIVGLNDAVQDAQSHGHSKKGEANVMKHAFILASLASVTLALGSAWADNKAGAAKPGAGKRPGKGDMAEMAFKKMDANGDGKVTQEEFKKMAEQRPGGKLKDKPEAMSKIFERMDENGDGYVTLEEFKKFRAKMAERMKDGKPGEKKPGEKKKDQK
jgi:hypothetical protein